LVARRNYFMKLQKLEMIRIRSGDFIRGENLQECDETYEAPRKKISLSAYEIQKSPVTVGMWYHFLNETKYRWEVNSKVIQVYQDIKIKTGINISTYLPDLVKLVSPTDRHPIVYVSWFDAIKFTEWLSDSSGLIYTLPTEAQWEKACRGINGQYYPWGNDLYLDCVDEFEEIALGRETNFEIASFPALATPYGCVDMWTNVSEWCLDWFDDGESYRSDSIENLKDPKGPDIGSYGYKIVRGGNIGTSGWPYCSKRKVFNPDKQLPHIGFRIVRNLSK
jgi:formylglycine-generating enzyme required for sulfatase activity